MAIHKWKYDDPFDSNSETNTYTFPRNPAKATSPILDRPISAQGNVGGGFSTWEAAPIAKQWSYSGTAVNRAHYDNLLAWHTRKNRFTVTDHFGRKMTVVPLSSDLVPETRRNNYWNHDYTITVLVLAYTAGASDIGDIWP